MLSTSRDRVRRTEVGNTNRNSRPPTIIKRSGDVERYWADGNVRRIEAKANVFAEGDAKTHVYKVASPLYLTVHYWWAYVHPNAVKLFERQWLVNLILWGNYARLRDAALTELGCCLPGRTLQVACVYGDLTNRLGRRAASGGGAVDVIDVLPIQLKNLQEKLATGAPVRLLSMDSTDLKLPEASYDRALIFFLLHEQPHHYRERTMSEVLRVVKPGGKIVIVDYALPHWWHPLRYLWRPVLAKLEPFALDLWRQPIVDWLPAALARGRLRNESFFGGLYQKVVMTR